MAKRKRAKVKPDSPKLLRHPILWWRALAMGHKLTIVGFVVVLVAAGVAIPNPADTERAWVVLKDAQATGPINANTQVDFNLFFDNTGNHPATDVTMCVRAEFRRAGKAPSDETRYTAEECGPAATFGGRIPGHTLAVHVKPMPPDDVAKAVIRSPEEYVIHGRVCYNDGFNQTSTLFCTVYQYGNDRVRFVPCNGHEHPAGACPEAEARRG